MGITTVSRETKIKVVSVRRGKVTIEVIHIWYDGPFPLGEPLKKEIVLEVGKEIIV